VKIPAKYIIVRSVYHRKIGQFISCMLVTFASMSNADTIQSCANVHTPWPVPNQLTEKPVLVRIQQGLGEPIVPCVLNSKIGSCILDTGSTISILANSRTSESFPSHCQIQGHNYGGETSPLIPIVRAENFRLGNSLQFDEIYVAREDDYPGLPQNLGVIGADVIISSSRFIFYFAKIFKPNSVNFMAITDSGSKALSKFVNFEKIEPDPRVIQFEVLIAQEPVNALLDTGGSSSAFSSQFIASHPSMFKFLTKARQSGGAIKDAAPTDVKYYRFSSTICLAQTCVRVPDQTVSAIDQDVLAGNDVLIGRDLAYQMSWMFDYKKGLYSVIKPPPRPAAPQTQAQPEPSSLKPFM
jgi:hypothetical protein